MARVFLLARPFWGRIFGISLLIVVMSSLHQLDPFIYRSLVDLVSSGQTTFFLFEKTTFVGLVIFLVILKVLLTVINRISIYSSSLLSSRLRHYLREIGFHHLLELSVSYFNRNSSGKVMSKMTRGTDGIRSIISNFGIQFLPGAVTAVISLFIVMRINWLIGLASVLVFIPFFYLRFIRYKQLSKLEKRQNKIWDREYGRFWEVISNIRLVKTFATERYELNKFRNVTGKLYQNNLKMEAINNKGTGADLLIDLWTAAIYAYIFHLGLTGQYTIGLVVLLISYVEMIKQPLWNLSWIFWEVKYAMIGIRDYLKISWRRFRRRTGENSRSGRKIGCRQNHHCPPPGPLL